MSPDGTIQATHLWKRFRADRGRLLLRDEIERVRARLRGRESDRWRWALRDVELDVQPGESVGLVGVNGSGKSTLLKMLARVMYPHAGTLDVSGRVAAMIEVRAGLHPDLSGRENIRLYGALLGLSKRDVAKRFDEIVAFAEIEDAIDRQIKYYSSGMQIRIGFAVAACLEPDILLVDEVLAVGDAAFQQKCLERLRYVLSQGTTLVFVSHDLAAVQATCQRGVWLVDGEVHATGAMGDVLAAYRRSIEESAEIEPRESGPLKVMKVEVGTAGAARTQGPLDVAVVFDSRAEVGGSLFLGISEGPATPIALVRRDLYLVAGENEVRCSIRSLPLPRGRFSVWLGFMDGRGRDLLTWRPAAHFDVMGPDLDTPPWAIVRLAPVYVEADWQVGSR
jgi:ABC-type polysaccharide/polyol phosphate transport system ATPase subunit